MAMTHYRERCQLVIVVEVVSLDILYQRFDRHQPFRQHSTLIGHHVDVLHNVAHYLASDSVLENGYLPSNRLLKSIIWSFNR
jgi:hypothetical protein